MNFSNKKWQKLEKDMKFVRSRNYEQDTPPPQLSTKSGLGHVIAKWRPYKDIYRDALDGKIKSESLEEMTRELSQYQMKTGDEEQQITDLIWMLNKGKRKDTITRAAVEEATNEGQESTSEPGKDHVEEILCRLQYINKHYKFSTHLKSEIKLIANNISNSEDRFEIRRQISMMHESLEDTTLKAATAAAASGEHSDTELTPSRDSLRTKVIWRKREESESGFTGVGKHRGAPPNQRLRRKKNAASKAAKVAKLDPKAGLPIIHLNKLSRVKFPKKAEEAVVLPSELPTKLNVVLPKPSYGSNAIRSELWKLSQLPEKHLSKYTALTDGDVKMFSPITPSVRTHTRTYIHAHTCTVCVAHTHIQ